jgi:hypothetical protein
MLKDGELHIVADPAPVEFLSTAQLQSAFPRGCARIALRRPRWPRRDRLGLSAAPATSLCCLSLSAPQLS